MATDPRRDIRIIDSDIELILEGLDWVRADNNGRLGLPDPDMVKAAICKENAVTRLQRYLLRRLTIRGQGNVGNYAEKL